MTAPLPQFKVHREVGPNADCTYQVEVPMTVFAALFRECVRDPKFRTQVLRCIDPNPEYNQLAFTAAMKCVRGRTNLRTVTLTQDNAEDFLGELDEQVSLPEPCPHNYPGCCPDPWGAA